MPNHVAIRLATRRGPRRRDGRVNLKLSCSKPVPVTTVTARVRQPLGRRSKNKAVYVARALDTEGQKHELGQT